MVQKHMSNIAEVFDQTFEHTLRTIDDLQIAQEQLSAYLSLMDFD